MDPDEILRRFYFCERRSLWTNFSKMFIVWRRKITQCRSCPVAKEQSITTNGTTVKSAYWLFILWVASVEMKYTLILRTLDLLEQHMLQNGSTMHEKMNGLPLKKGYYRWTRVNNQRDVTANCLPLHWFVLRRTHSSTNVFLHMVWCIGLSSNSVG